MIYAKEKTKGAKQIFGSRYAEIRKGFVAKGLYGGQGHSFYERFRVIDDKKEKLKKRLSDGKITQNQYDNLLGNLKKEARRARQMSIDYYKNFR